MSATVDFILWKGILVRISVRSISFIVMFGLSAAMFIPNRHALASGQAGRSSTSAPETDAESAANLLPGSTQLINPEALVNILQSPKAAKPLILNIGPHLHVYAGAHSRLRVHRSQFGFAGDGISAKTGEAAAAEHVHRSLLRVLPLESTSQRASRLLPTAQSGASPR